MGFEAHVEAGVRKLDAERPGWRRLIYLDTLDMADPYRCVLGQVYGSYARGLDELSIREDYGVYYGFEIGEDDYNGTSKDTFEAFEDLLGYWIAEIGGDNA